MTAEIPKKIDVRILSMRCPECVGSGWKFFGFRMCKRCFGTGDVLVSVDPTPALYMSPNDSFALCPDCTAGGRIIKRDCLNCRKSRRKLIFGDFGRRNEMPKAYDPWMFNPHAPEEEKMNKKELEKRLKDQLDNIEKLKKDADETLRKLKGGEVACSFYDPLWEPQSDHDLVFLPGHETSAIRWDCVTDNTKAIGGFFQSTDAIARWKLDLVEWKKFMDMGLPAAPSSDRVVVPIISGSGELNYTATIYLPYSILPQFLDVTEFWKYAERVDRDAIIRVMRRRAKGWI